jgi:hypothetical protein
LRFCNYGFSQFFARSFWVKRRKAAPTTANCSKFGIYRKFL